MEEKLVKKPHPNQYPPRPPVEKIIEAVKNTGGIYTNIAQKLGICRDTVAACVRDYPEVAAAVLEEKERITDGAESELMKAIKRGDMSAIMFYLRCKGRARGYNDRVDSHISGTLAINAAQPPSIDEIAKLAKEIDDAIAGDV